MQIELNNKIHFIYVLLKTNFAPSVASDVVPYLLVLASFKAKRFLFLAAFAS